MHHRAVQARTPGPRWSWPGGSLTATRSTRWRTLVLFQLEASLVFDRMNQKVRAKKPRGAQGGLPGGTAMISKPDGAGPIMIRAQRLRGSGGSAHALGPSKEELKPPETVLVQDTSATMTILGPGTTPTPHGKGQMSGSGHAMRAAVEIEEGPNEGKERSAAKPRGPS